MSLTVGIVGLPNVGKSTLFNSLMKRNIALAANYPFATIEPNVGIVDVPDERLKDLVDYVHNDYGTKIGEREIPERTVPSVVKFIDIAGLVKGASRGEGLGNAFLGHIREVDAIAQVVRCFEDENVIRAGSSNPLSDIEVINTELILADIQMLEKKISKLKSDSKNRTDKKAIRLFELAEECCAELDRGFKIDMEKFEDEDRVLLKELGLLSSKPVLYVLNVSESGVDTDMNNKIAQSVPGKCIQISAKIESELSDLTDDEKRQFMADIGIKEPGLNRLIRECFSLLDLQCYLTMGPKEVRSWTVKKGSKAPKAAAEIHTDFEKGFISAEVINYSEMREIRSWKKAKEKGLIRLEGKEYTMQDGDIVEFRINL